MSWARASLSVLIGLALTAGAPTVAGAAETADDAVDPLIMRVLEEVPGGVVLDEHHAVWPRIDMAMAVPDDVRSASRAAAACSSGRICAFNAYNRAGAQLSWGSCGNIPIPSSFATRSTQNARGSGHMIVRNGSSVLATVYAGGWVNITGSANNIVCYL
jgi:hypothetical protein